MGRTMVSIPECSVRRRKWKAAINKEVRAHPECDGSSACQRLTRTLPDVFSKVRNICCLHMVESKYGFSLTTA